MQNYVLITPARNEEEFIEKTIKSVIAQTILPKKWIIVSDGSTDRTDEIVSKYLPNYNFIELVKKKSDEIRNFGSKAKAISIAYNKLKELDFGFIGNLDADVSFDEKYYESILLEFDANPKLGIAGGLRYDLLNGKFSKLNCAPDSVGGPFQLFRRECYEEIDGYRPSKFGGIDAIAEVSARMKGWEVKMFPQHKILHYRPTGTAIKSVMRQRFRAGQRNYSVGYHPLFQLMRLYKTALVKPYFIGSLVIFCGYLWGAMTESQRPVSKEFIRFLRLEQLNKMKSFIRLKQTEVPVE